MDIIQNKRAKLEKSLFRELEFRSITSLPTNLVKVTAAILSKIFAENSNFEVLEIVGFGSIWAWALDEITDNPKINLQSKIPFLRKYISLLNMVDLKDQIAYTSNMPATSSLIIDCINKIIQYSDLNSLDIKLIKEEYRDCLQGFEYEVINMGKKVNITDSLYYRSYSYVPPFYGAMVYVADFHVKNLTDFKTLRDFLRLFGEITRLHNDLATYSKEAKSKEINIVLLLMSQNISEKEAVVIAKQYLSKAITKYNEIKKDIPNKDFVRIIDRFVEVHGEMYDIKNVRLIDPNTI